MQTTMQAHLPHLLLLPHQGPHHHIHHEQDEQKVPMCRCPSHLRQCAGAHNHKGPTCHPVVAVQPLQVELRGLAADLCCCQGCVEQEGLLIHKLVPRVQAVDRA